MSKSNPFVIKKSEEKGVLKINPTPIICKTNCSSHGSVTDPSSSKRFDGLQFFPLRIDKSLVTYEDSETGNCSTDTRDNSLFTTEKKQKFIWFC